MTARGTLENYLQRYSERGPVALAAAAAIDAVAVAAAEIAELIGQSQMYDTNNRDSRRSRWKDSNSRTDGIIRRCLSKVPLAAFASEDACNAEFGEQRRRVCIAISPLDCSSNIDINVTLGTIFSILPAPDDLKLCFNQRGCDQIAAGFVSYGPQTSLVLTTGEGVDLFIFDQRASLFRQSARGLRIPQQGTEFAINAATRRHWDAPVRAFIDECLAGAEGPAEREFNMRWIASVVAETQRILVRGGVFLCPSDTRPGYCNERLRLVYKAHPIAFIMEQAGGLASTGRERILDLSARSLHQSVPLIMGSSYEVQRLEQLYADSQLELNTTAPLFARRGILRP